MDPAEREKLAGQARVLKALAHPTRLLLIRRLAQGKRCVQELTEAAGVDISTVSKHLSVLKEAGILESQRQGLNIYYNLKLPCVLDFFVCAEQALNESAAEGAPKARKAS